MAEADDADASDRWWTAETVVQGDCLVVTGTAASQAPLGESNQALPVRHGDKVAVIERISSHEVKVRSSNGWAGVLPLRVLKRGLFHRDEAEPIAAGEGQEDGQGVPCVDSVASQDANRIKGARQADIGNEKGRRGRGRGEGGGEGGRKERRAEGAWEGSQEANDGRVGKGIGAVAHTAGQANKDTRHDAEGRAATLSHWDPDHFSTPGRETPQTDHDSTQKDVGGSSAATMHQASTSAAGLVADRQALLNNLTATSEAKQEQKTDQSSKGQSPAASKQRFKTRIRPAQELFEGSSFDKFSESLGKVLAEDSSSLTCLSEIRTCFAKNAVAEIRLDRIAGELLDYTEQKDNNMMCFAVCTLMLNLSLRRLMSAKTNMKSILSKVWQSKKFIELIHVVGDRAAALKEDFWKDPLCLSSMLTGHPDDALLSPLITVLSAACFAQGAFYMLALMVVDSNVRQQNNWPTRSWKKYLGNLQMAAFVNQDISAIFPALLYFYKSVRPELDGHVLAYIITRLSKHQTGKQSPMTIRGLSQLLTVTATFNKDRAERQLVIQSITDHILKTIPPPLVSEFIKTMLSFSIKDFDQKSMQSVLEHLAESIGKSKTDCNPLVAMLRALSGITASVEDSRQNADGMAVLRECFVDHWSRHRNDLPKTWIDDVRSFLSNDRPSAHVREFCIGLAVICLERHQLACSTAKQITALVDLLHDAGRDDLITERLINVLGSVDGEHLHHFICSSKCLSQSYEVKPEAMQAVMNLMRKKMRFPSLRSIKDVLEEASGYYQQVRRASPLHSKNSMVALLWTVCAMSMQHQITQLIQQKGIEQLAPLKEFRLPCGEDTTSDISASNLDLAATAYLHVLLGALDIDTGVRYHKTLWLVPCHMLDTCYEAYTSLRQHSSCFCPEKYEHLCKCMTDLQQKLDSGNYTQAEFEAYSDHVEKLQEILGALKLKSANGLPSFDDLLAKARKLQLLLEWLQRQGVEGSHRASSHLMTLVDDKNVTYRDMRSAIVVYEKRFVKPLSMFVAGDCAIPVSDYVCYFVETGNYLFEEFVIVAASEASPQQYSNQPWPKVAKALIHNVHSRFKELLSGQLKIEYVHRLLVQGLPKDRSICDELRTVLSYSPYFIIIQGHNVDRTHIIEETLTFIAIAQSLKAAAGCDAVISYHLLSSDDKIFTKFHALCSKPLGDFTLRAFYDDFSGLMHACDSFQDLQNALTLLSKAKEYTKVMAFFKENDCHSDFGKEVFTQKKDLLNSQLRQGSFDADLVDALIDAHSMLAPLLLASRALMKPPFPTFLSEIAKNEVFNVDSLWTVEQHMFRLRELWEEASASTTEVTRQQLQRLIQGGTAHLQLRAVLCQSSRMEFSYRQGNSALNMDDNSHLSEEEMRDFRSRLQYLLVLQPEETTSEEGRDEESDFDAMKFSDLLHKVDDLWSVLLCLERLGHPDFQQCVYSVPLNYSTVTVHLKDMIALQNAWRISLQTAQQQCSLLQLLNHDNIGALLLLLKRVVSDSNTCLLDTCEQPQPSSAMTQGSTGSFSNGSAEMFQTPMHECGIQAEGNVLGSNQDALGPIGEVQNGSAVNVAKAASSSKDSAPMVKHSSTLGCLATLPAKQIDSVPQLPASCSTGIVAEQVVIPVSMGARGHQCTEQDVAIQPLQGIRRQDLTSCHDINDVDFTKELLGRFMFSLETTHLEMNSGYNLCNLYQECAQISNRTADHFLEVLVNMVHRTYTIPPDLVEKHSEQLGRQVVYFFQSDGDTCITTDIMLVLADLFVKEHGCFPLGGQVLHCSEQSTEDDLKLFFQRVKSFPYLQFALVGVDRLSYYQRGFVMNQQQYLMYDLQGHHADIYYICVKSTTTSTWLQPFMETRIHSKIDHPKPSDIKVMYKRLCGPVSKSLQVITVVGETGSGKSHWILKRLQNAEHKEIITIQASADFTSIIKKLSSLPWHKEASVFFDISEQLCLPAVNHMFFELLFCGGLQDKEHGALFCFPPNTRWKLYVELPGSCVDGHQTTAVEGATEKYLPLVAAYPWSQERVMKLVEEPVHWTDIDRRLIRAAGILRSFNRRNPDLEQLIHNSSLTSQVSLLEDNSEELESVLAPLLRRPARKCLERKQEGKATEQQSVMKMSMREKVAFLRFLAERLTIFEDNRFLSQVQEKFFGTRFPSSLLQQFIREAYTLSMPSLACSWRDCDQFFLIPEYCSNKVAFYGFNKPDRSLPSVFSDQAIIRTSAALRDTKTAACGGSHLMVFLQWTFGLTADRVQALLRQEKFVLTNDFTLKLLLVHARYQAHLPLIIEGETGVGKTFLLNMFALLLNEQVLHDIQASSTYHQETQFSNWLITTIENEDWGDRSRAIHRWFNKPKSSSQASPRDILLMPGSTHDQLNTVWLDFLSTLMPKTCPKVHKKAVCLLANQIQRWHNSLPLLICDRRSKKILTEHSVSGSHPPSACPLTGKDAEELLNHFLDAGCQQFFFRLLIHPGLSMTNIEQFLWPICKIAKREQMKYVHFVVFFDEVNTSRCPGLFKEIMLDNRFDSQPLPENIFFVAAINPKLERKTISTEYGVVPQEVSSGYNVHDLHPVMDSIKWIYGGLNVREDIVEYIELRVDFLDSFTTLFESSQNEEACEFRFEGLLKDRLVDTLVIAHKFCDEEIGPSSVSQRDIQRVFDLIPFFWKVENYYILHENEQAKAGSLSLPFSESCFSGKKVLQRCVYLAVALVYYFRLPTTPKNKSNSRLKFENHFRKNATDPQYQHLYKFEQVVSRALNKFVTKEHFSIPKGIALTSALRENILCTVACIQQCIPLGIIGPPGSSKTLSYHIVRDNLRGKHSPTTFCSQFVEIDTFFYQCSELSEANEIDALFKKAIERQKHIIRSQHQASSAVKKRCVVFLDEAGLPPQDRMVLKVLHQFLDNPEVAFVALSNYEFDPANTNRMLTVCRSRDLHDLQTLAEGCVLLDDTPTELIKNYLSGICHGFEEVMSDDIFGKLFHHRDMIYTLRHLRRHQLKKGMRKLVPDDHVLLKALEENFGGVQPQGFRALADIFFRAVHKSLERYRSAVNFPSSLQDSLCRDNTAELRIIESLLHRQPSVRAHDTSKSSLSSHGSHECSFSTGHPLAPRFVMIIDPTNAYVALDILYHIGLLTASTSQVVQMTDNPDEIQRAETLAKIRHALEQPKTLVLVNTRSIHGSLYELLNQNFRHLSTARGRSYTYTNIAAGARMHPCHVHKEFRCIVVMGEKEMNAAPAPFLSRFSKVRLSPDSALTAVLHRLEKPVRASVHQLYTFCQSFLGNIGEMSLFGYNAATLPCLMLSHIKAHDRVFTYEPTPTPTAELVHAQFNAVTQSRQQLKSRVLCSRLLQLLPPKHFLLKDESLKASEVYRSIYFDLLTHFSLSDAISRLLQSDKEQSTCRKMLIYTPTCHLQLWKSELPENVEIIDTARFVHVSASDIEHCLDGFIRAQPEKQCAVILVDASRWHSTATKTSDFVLYQKAIDEARSKTENSNNLTCRGKCFALVVHYPVQQQYACNSCPAKFLHGWDTHLVNGPSRQPLLNIPTFARCCWSPVNAGQVKELTTLIQTNSACHRRKLAERWCSHVLNVVGVKPSVVSKLPVQVHPLYQSLNHDELATVGSRFRALEFVLDRCPLILEQVSYQVACMVTQNCHSQIKSLARQAAHEAVLFADLVTEWLASLHSEAFIRVVSCLSKDYGLGVILKSELSSKAIKQLLNLTSDSEQQSLPTCISCSQYVPVMPLFHSLNQQMTDLIKQDVYTHSRDLTGIKQRLHKVVMNNDVLKALNDCPDLVRTYSYDLVHHLGHVHSVKNEAGLQMALHWCHLMANETQEENDMISHLHVIMYCYKEDILHFLLGTAALQSISEQFVHNLQKFINANSSLDPDDYKEQFYKHLLLLLWDSLVSLPAESSNSAGKQVQSWLRGYSLVMEMLDSIHDVSSQDMQYVTELMAIARILLSCCNVLSNESRALRAFTDILKQLKGSLQMTHLSSSATVTQLLTALQNALGPHCSGELRTSFVELLLWLVGRLSTQVLFGNKASVDYCDFLEKTDTLHFLIEVINYQVVEAIDNSPSVGSTRSAQGVPFYATPALQLSYEAKKELLLVVCQELNRLIGVNNADHPQDVQTKCNKPDWHILMKLLVEQQLSKHEERLPESPSRGQLYLATFYQPRDADVTTNLSPPALKTVLSHIYFDFFVEELMDNKVFLSLSVQRATGENFCTLPPGSQGPRTTDVLYAAACVRVMLNQMVEEIDSVWDGTHMQLNDVWQRANAEHLAGQVDWPYNRLYFANQLIRRRGEHFAWRFLSHIRKDWALPGTENTPAFSADLPFSFVEQTPLSDHLPEFRCTYSEFSQVFETCTGDDCFQPLVSWCEKQQSQDSQKFGQLKYWDCIAMFLLFKVYVDYFSKSASHLARVQPLLYALNESAFNIQKGSVAYRAIHLLFHCPDNAFSEVKAMFVPGRCEATNMQVIRDILVSILGCLLALGEPGNFFSTCLMKPQLLLKSYVFGAVCYRASLHYDLKLDCCFQFEADGSPTIRGQQPNLQLLSHHFCGLMTFSNLLLHSLLYPESCESNLRAILTEGEVMRMSAANTGYVQSVQGFCLYRVAHLQNFITKDEQLHCPTAVVSLIAPCLEQLLLLSMNSPLKFLPMYKDQGSRAQAEQVFQRQVIKGGCEFYCIHQTKLQLCGSGKWHGAPAMLMTASNKQPPVITTANLRDSMNEARNPDQLNVMSHLMANITYLSLLPEATDIAQLCLWLHENLSGRLTAAEAQNFNLKTAFDHYLQSSTKQEAALAQEIYKNGLHAFNRSWTLLGGSLLAGSCAEEDCFMKLSDESPLPYVLRARHVGQFGTDILWEVASFLVRKQKDLLLQCHTTRDVSPTSTVSHLLAACHLDKAVPFHHVLEQNGNGLVKIQQADLEHLVVMHGELAQDDFGRWRGKFNLTELQQVMVSRFLMQVWDIELDRSSMQYFEFKPPPPEELRHLAIILPPLNPELPHVFIRSELSRKVKNSLHQKFRRLPYHDVLAGLQKLVLVSNVIQELVSSDRDLDIDELSTNSVAEFIHHQELELDDKTESEQCYKDLSLEYLSSLYQLCIYHLNQDEYFFQDGLPALLHCDIIPELKELAAASLDEVTKASPLPDPTEVVMMVSEAIGCLQAVLQDVTKDPNTPLHKLLQESKSHCKLLEQLPTAIRGHHVKGLIVLLLQEGRHARGKHLDMLDLPQLEHREQWEEPTDVESTGDGRPTSLLSTPASSLLHGQSVSSQEAWVLPSLLHRADSSMSPLSVDREESLTLSHSSWYLYNITQWPLADKLGSNVLLETAVMWHVNLYEWRGEVISPASPIVKTKNQEITRLLRIPRQQRECAFLNCSLSGAYLKCEENPKFGLQKGSFKFADNNGYILQASEDVSPMKNQVKMRVVLLADVLTVQFILGQVPQQQRCEIELNRFSSAKEATRVAMRCFGCIQSARAVLHLESGEMVLPDRLLGDVAHDKKTSSKLCLHLALEPTVVGSKDVPELFLLSYAHEYLSSVLDKPAQATELWPSVQFLSETLTSKQKVDAWLLHPQATFNVLIIITGMAKLHLKIAATASVGFIKEQALSRAKVSFQHDSCLCLTPWQSSLPAIPLCDNLILWQLGVDAGVPLVMELVENQEGPVTLCVEMPSPSSEEVQSCYMVLDGTVTTAVDVIDAAVKRMSITEDVEWALVDLSTQCRLDKEPISHWLRVPTTKLLLVPVESLCHCVVAISSSEATTTATQSNTALKDHLLYEHVDVSYSATCTQVLCHLANTGICLPRVSEMTGPVRLFASPGISLSACIRLSCIAQEEGGQHCHFTVGNFHQYQDHLSSEEVNNEQVAGGSNCHQPPAIVFIELRSAELELQPIKVIIDESTELSALVKFTACSLLQKPPSVCTLHVGAFELTSYSTMAAGTLLTSVSSDLAVRKGLGKYGSHDFPLCCEVREHEYTPADCAPGKVMVRATNCLSSSDGAQEFRLYLPLEANAQDIVSAAWAHFEDEERSTYSENNICVKLDLADNNEEIAGRSLADFIQLVPSGVLQFSLCSADTGVTINIEAEDKAETRTQIMLPKSTSTTALFSIIANSLSISTPYECLVNGYVIDPDEETTLGDLLTSWTDAVFQVSPSDPETT